MKNVLIMHMKNVFIMHSVIIALLIQKSFHMIRDLGPFV